MAISPNGCTETFMHKNVDSQHRHDSTYTFPYVPADSICAGARPRMRPKAAHESSQMESQGPLLIRRQLKQVDAQYSCSPKGRIHVPRKRYSCRGHLTRTEGRDGAATAGEGRRDQAIHLKRGRRPATFTPRRRRAVSCGFAARQMRRGSWSREALPSH